MVGKDLPVVVTGVTTIWASPRFGKPHSPKPSDMGILSGTAEGEGLVGPRPHHFFASPPPLFALKRKMIKIIKET